MVSNHMLFTYCVSNPREILYRKTALSIMKHTYITEDKHQRAYPGFDLDISVEMRKDLRNGSRFWPLCRHTQTTSSSD